MFCFAGWCLGSGRWQKFPFGHKRYRKQRPDSSPDPEVVFEAAPEIVPEVVRKRSQKHSDILVPKEVAKLYETGGTFFLSKSCTKVHLVRDCSGLNSADQYQIKAIPLCLHCLNYMRKMKKYDRDEEEEGHKRHKEEKGT